MLETAGQMITKSKNFFFYFLLLATLFFSLNIIFLNRQRTTRGEITSQTFIRNQLTTNDLESTEKPQVLGQKYQYPQLYISGSKEGWGFGGIIPLASTDEPAIQIASYDLNGTAQIETYQANESAILNFLVHDKDGKQINKTVDTTNFQHLGTSSVEIYKGYNNSTKVTLPLTDSGIWYVKVKLGEAEQHALVVRSQTGVIVKEGDNEFIFWGQNFQSHRSITEGDVTLYYLQDQINEVGKISFNNDGVAKTNLTTDADVGLVHVGSDIALIPINLHYLNTGYDYRQFQVKQKEAKFFVFTDRPLYKPGDKVYFKSIIRDDDDARYSIPSGTAKIKITKGYSYDDEKALFEKNYPIGTMGTVEGEFSLPDSAATGYYTLEVNLGSESSQSDWQTRSRLTSSTSFQVQYYRKPEYFLDISVPQKEFIAGDKSYFTISGQYFFGQPIIGQKVNYKVFSADFWEYGYYLDRESYLNDDYRYGYWGGIKIKEDSVILNDQGEARIDLGLEFPENIHKNQVFTIEAELIEESGNPAFVRKNVLVFSGEYSIFQEDYLYGVKVGDQANLNLKLAPHQTTKISQIPLKAKINRKTWIKYQEPDKKYPSYKEETETLPEIQTTTTGNGQAIFSIIPKKEGSYTITVEGQDSRGNLIKKDFYFWASSKDQPFYTQENQGGLSLQTDKKEYAHGDSAKLIITSEIPNRDVFLSFDRARVNRYQVIRLNNNQAIVDTELKETDMPNIFATVTSFSENYLETNSQNLIVSTNPKKLMVKTTLDKVKYGPGEKTTINIQTTDVTGKPVSANLAVWAVDKALFELVNEKPRKIFDAFWLQRYNGTQQSHSLEGINVRTAEMGGCFAAETPILLANGKTKPIGKITKGEKILTRKSPVDSGLVKAKVIGTHRQEVAGYLIINQRLKVTPNHRLWVNENWKEASQIQLGDKLRNPENQTEVVSSIEWQNGKFIVYNLEIEEYRTYFAGNTWVHNQKGESGAGRSVFKDTAYWNPMVQTNENGQAQIQFQLPDNLTTWVLAAIGATIDTKVGQSTAEILVTKDIIVRPILPNILRSDDEIVLSALVQNFTENSHPFDISLESDALKIESFGSNNVNIEPAKIEQFFWKVKPVKENLSTKLTFIAKATDGSQLYDKVTLELPIKAFGFWEKRGENADGPTNFSLKLTADSDKNLSKITLSLAPSLFGTLPSAMKYLVDYPYGCIEQTTSRFVPAVIAKRYPDFFQEALSGKDIEGILKRGIEKLTSLQKPDGGWTWWYAGNSDYFVTAYVVEYLLAAKELGVEGSEEILALAQNFLETEPHDNAQPSTSYLTINEANIARKYALTLLKSDKAETISINTENLTPDFLALVVMTNVKNGERHPEKNGLNKLISLAKAQGDQFYWEAGKAHSFGSKDASTALALRAIIASGGEREVAVKASRYLLKNRRLNYWANTFATAQTIQATADFVTVGKEANPDYDYTVKLDGQEIAQGKVNNSQQILKEIVVPGSKIKDVGSQIEIQKSGEGQIYSTLLIEEFHRDKKAKAANHGLEIKREYLNSKGLEYNFGVGDTVTVKLTVSGLNSPQDYGVIDDELPAGMIPINPFFKNEQFKTNYTPYHYGVSGQEITDNGAVLSLYQMDQGTQVYTYQARVVSEGDFLVPPATVSLMYSPEIYGRSEVQTIKIERESKAEPMPVREITKIISNLSRKPLLILIILVFFLLPASIGLAVFKGRGGNFKVLKEKFWRRFKKNQTTPPNDQIPPPPQNEI